MKSCLADVYSRLLHYQNTKNTTPYLLFGEAITEKILFYHWSKSRRLIPKHYHEAVKTHPWGNTNTVIPAQTATLFPLDRTAML